MEFFRQVLVITDKDVRAELRTKEAVNASFAFALVMLLLFSFAFDPESETMKRDLPAACCGSCSPSPARGAQPQLRPRAAQRLPGRPCVGADIGRRAISGKALANYALVLAVELVSLPVFGIFYDVVEPDAIPAETAADFGARRLGADGNRHDVQRVDGEHPASRSNAADDDLSDPRSPALMGAMRLTAALIQGPALDKDTLIWLKLLVGFDAVYTAAALVLVDFVLVG